MSETSDSTATRGWALLRAGSVVSSGIEVPSFVHEVHAPAGPVRLSVGLAGEPRLLLPLPFAVQETTIDFDAGDTLAIAEVSLLVDGRAQRFLDLTCTARHLEAVFTEVVEQIIARIAAGTDVVEATRSTLDDFRTLLARARPGSADIRKVAGLVAELLILDRLLTSSPKAWRSWRGPAGDRHDFRNGDVSLETKASLRAEATAITINGISQLDPPSGGVLNLVHVILEPVPGGLLTVSELANSALRKASDPAGLRELMMGAECPDPAEQGWNTHRFRLEAEYFYRVVGAFPRVVPSSFLGGVPPRGVTHMSYRIDLSQMAEFRCSPEDASRLMESLVG